MKNASLELFEKGKFVSIDTQFMSEGLAVLQMLQRV